MYYATAMIAMAREAGIPSRLAAGYITIPGGNGTQKVDASSPYAWVECYLPNVGWVSFNPTPEVKARPLSIGGGADGFDGDSPNVIVEDVRKKEKQNPKKETLIKWDEKANIPLIIALSLAALLVLALICNTLFSQKFYQLKMVRKRYKTTEKQAEYYYLDILRQYRWLGARYKKYETLKEITNKVCTTFDQDQALKVQKAVEIIEAQLYGEQMPSDGNVEAIAEARMTLESILKDKNNSVMYVIKRRLLLPIFNVAPRVYTKLDKIKK